VVSGVVNSLDEIRKGLLKRRHTPFLFAPEVKGYREKHAGVFRFPSVEFDRSVEFPVPIPFSARLSRLVQRMDLDLIHSHHPILIGATAANFAKRHKLPLVYTFHTQIEQYTHYVPFFSHETVRDAARSKVSRYLAKCELIICPSPTIRDLIDSYGVTTRVETVPNAIDTKKFTPPHNCQTGLRERLGLPSETVISVSVGRLASEKGLPFLLRAFAALGCDEAHHLVMVGSGPQGQELREMSRELGLESRVHFLGALPYREMPSVYGQCDLFAICSTTEVKPLVVLEAMASGLPVLAVSACGTRDTVTHGKDGLLCSLDEEQFGAAWARLSQDRTMRKTLGEEGRRSARNFGIDAYVDKLCRLYQEVLSDFHSRKVIHSETG
jgi:glycosyltransferase involved in cell wall biosynthesis